MEDKTVRWCYDYDNDPIRHVFKAYTKLTHARTQEDNAEETLNEIMKFEDVLLLQVLLK